MQPSSKAPSVSSQNKTSQKKRLVLLFGLLIMLSILAIALKYDNLREKWLASQSVESLKRDSGRVGNDFLFHLIYGEKLSASGNHADAVSQFQLAEHLLANDPKNPNSIRLLSNLGYSLAAAQNDTSATLYLNQVIKADEDNAPAHLGFGLVFLHRRMPQYAVTQFQFVISKEPKNFQAHYLLGKAFNENVEPQSAEEELKTAIKLSPGDSAAHAELGHAYAYQAKFPPAVEQFQLALKYDPNNPDIQRALGAAMGMSARTRDQYQVAVALLEKELKDEPENENLLFTLGQLHLRFQSIPEASKYLKRTIQLKPGHAEAWYNLSRVEQLQGNRIEANAATQKFKDLSALHDNAVIAEKKVAANLKDPKVRMELSRCYRKTGNMVGAYWQLRTALLLNPNNPEATKEMVQVEASYRSFISTNAGKQMTRGDASSFGPPPPPELMSAVTGQQNGRNP